MTRPRRLLPIFTLAMSVGWIGAAGEAAAAITVYPRVGSPTDSTITPQGPGLVVMGGGNDVDTAFVWMHDTIAGSSAVSAGDVTVLRATGANAYDAYIAGLTKFNSVQTLVIPTPASASDLSTAAAIIDKAEVVFFTGGNQADYVGWKGSALMTAVAAVYQRGGAIGGTSAGAAVLGQFIFDSVTATSGNVASADAVANPFEATISFTRNMLPLTILNDAITDPHFVVRDRFGRLAAFMARQLADGAASGVVHGIGVDEGNAIVIGKDGIGTLKQYTHGSGSAFVITGGAPTTISAGQPLVYPMLTVTRLDADGQTYDFNAWCGNTTTYRVGVDGTATPIYNPASPYTAPGVAGTCNVSGGDMAVVTDGGGGGGGNGGGNGGGGSGGSGGGGSGGSADMARLVGPALHDGGGCDCRVGSGAAVPTLAWLLLVVPVICLRPRRSRR